MVRRLMAVFLTFLAILAAGWLALRRADIPFHTLEAAYASPNSQFMTLKNGTKLHYRDEGRPDGEPLFLVHGFAASLHTWEPWVAELGDKYRIVSLDLPGHGLTRTPPPGGLTISAFADSIAEVSERLDIDRFALAGNSMGGNTAWTFALKYPERLNALILVDASGWPQNNDGSSSLIFRALSNPLARSILKDLDTSALVRGGLEDSFADPSFVTDAMVERYVSLSRAPLHRDAIISLRTQSRVQASHDTLGKIGTPTLILQGAEDNLVPAYHAELFAEAIAGSELKIYPSVGHLPQEEIAEESADDVHAFLSSLDRPAEADTLISGASEGTR